jgi:hypothetical protein
MWVTQYHVGALARWLKTDPLPRSLAAPAGCDRIAPGAFAVPGIYLLRFFLSGFPQSGPRGCDEQPLLRMQEAENPIMDARFQELIEKFANPAGFALRRTRFFTNAL